MFALGSVLSVMLNMIEILFCISSALPSVRTAN
mgnify:CR=1 FL=1